MVQLCRERGLEAEAGDLFAALAGVPEASLGGVVSFHVIEHLPAAALDRLVRLAYRALRPGGVLILETPNPLSVVVAARNFWLDPTHVRPVHPDSLKLMYELAGFDPVERLDLRPFPADQALPEIDLATLPAEQRLLADRVNRLRDRLDEVLFGFQDFGMVGRKGKALTPDPSPSPPPALAWERGTPALKKGTFAFAFLPLLSRQGWVEGWEKRAGVMRALTAAAAPPAPPAVRGSTAARAGSARRWSCSACSRPASECRRPSAGTRGGC